MQFTRRQTLKLSIYSLFIGNLLSRSNTVYSGEIYSKNFLSSLTTLIGFLIDDGGNNQQIVLKKTLERMHVDLVFEKTLIKGINKLEKMSLKKYNKNISSLNTGQKQNIIESIEVSRDRLLTRFYHTINQDILTHYYALPTSWNQLGFNGPPQPKGFPDHAKPHTKPARI